MTRIIGWWLAGALLACGDRPAMQNIPRPAAGEAAGAAALAAAAATLADPEAALRPRPEAQEDDGDRRDRRDHADAPRPPVPGEVLDRVERSRTRAGATLDAADADDVADVPTPDGDPARPRTGPRPDLRLPPRPPAP